MAKLKVRKVTPGQDDQELVIDESELTEDETVEEEIEEEVPETEEGEGDDPKVSVEDNVQEDLSNHTEQTLDDISQELSEDLQEIEQDFITLLHTVENGTLILASRSYEIIDHEVNVLAEDFQDCIHHGLIQKE